MTLHVGMIGSDGFIIASDTLRSWVNPQAPRNPQRTHAPKIYIEGRFVCAFAGYQPRTNFLRELAIAAPERLSEAYLDDFCSRFFEMYGVERITHEILLGHADDPTRLWQIKSYPPAARRTVDVLEVSDQATNEVSINAHFVPVLFYELGKSVEQLILPAALTIWYGERENNGAVKGLQIIKCCNGRIDMVDVSFLSDRCRIFDKSVRQLIWND